MKDRPFFWLSAVAILASLLIMVAMSITTTKADLAKPTGYRSPILALEFAQDTPVIQAVFQWAGSDRATIKSRANGIAKATDLDYGFILTYTSFMLLFALIGSRMGLRYPWLAAIFALLAGSADVMENIQLKEIFGRLSAGETDLGAIFPTLHAYASLKFFSTAAFFLALAPFFWKANALGKGIVLAATSAMVCWIQASFYRPEFWADTLFGMIVLAFAGAMFFGLFYKANTATSQ